MGEDELVEAVDALLDGLADVADVAEVADEGELVGAGVEVEGAGSEEDGEDGRVVAVLLEALHAGVAAVDLAEVVLEGGVEANEGLEDDLGVLEKLGWEKK